MGTSSKSKISKATHHVDPYHRLYEFFISKSVGLGSIVNIPKSVGLGSIVNISKSVGLGSIVNSMGGGGGGCLWLPINKWFPERKKKGENLASERCVTYSRFAVSCGEK